MFSLSFRPVIAALVSLSIAITALGATATPARAENNREAVAVIGGLVALWAIGRAIQTHNSRSEPAPRHEPVQPVPHPRRMVAPQRCYIEGYNGNRFIHGYVRRCMQNNVPAAHLLPQNCLRHVQTYRGPRNVYARRCLVRNGWTVS